MWKLQNSLRYLVVPAVIAGLLVPMQSFNVSKAATVSLDDLLAQLEELRTLIEELRTQRQTIQEARQETMLDLRQFLQEGATGDEVSRLQEYLALDSEIYPEGLVTGYFGKLTSAAVKRFQQRHQIMQTGTLGPQTRNKLQEMFSGGWLASGELPPGLTHAPGILKKENGICEIPGIAKRLSYCSNVDDDKDEDEDEDEEETELEVTTLYAYGIEDDSARLKCRVVTGEADAQAWFEWGEDEEDLDEETDKVDVDADDSVVLRETIDELSADTEYFFRCVAEDEDGTEEGDVKSFTTEK